MARLVTSGAEIYASTAEVASAPDGKATGSVSRDTTTKRSGAAAFKCTPVTNVPAYNSWTFAGAATCFARACFIFGAMPSAAQVQIMRMSTGAGGHVDVWVQSDGVVVFGCDSFSTGTTAVITTGVWYRFEIYGSPGAGASECTLRIDGVTISALTGQTIAGVTFTQLDAGWVAAPGTANFQVNVDDVAVNDANGSDQNSYPGEGKIVLLMPTSDSVRGQWTDGVGGLTNLWDAVNNTPPIGTATETALTQIENTVNDLTDPAHYIPQLASYASAGLSSADAVSVVQAVVNHGEDVATGTKTGKFRIDSNPAVAAYDTFTFGADAGALGTWPSFWTWTKGAPTYSPAVTVSTGPTIRLGKTDTGTRVASADFVGVIVEYVPGVPARPRPVIVSQAVARAAAR